MSRPVKTRGYRSQVRERQAQLTRQAVLTAARALFAEQGYAATTVAQVAAGAGVAVDTVYAAVGRKPQVLLALVDEALAGRADSAPSGTPTSSVERDYVAAVQAAVGARAKLETYAAALADRLPHVTALVTALAEAAATDPQARRALDGLSDRRARMMRRLAADLRSTGELRTDWDDGQVADLIWSMNASEYHALLQQRGYAPSEVAALLGEVWTRVLLADPVR